MPTGIYIDASGLKVGREKLERLAKEMPGRVNDVLVASAEAIVTEAKRNAPADRGPLRQGISFDDSKPLQKTITSQAPYSAYVEFGTGKYAADYVASLPPNFQAFAASFQGKTGGKFSDFVLAIFDWMKRKGIGGGTYSVKTRRREGSKDTQNAQDLSIAYAIAKTIYKNGIHPHPFLLPAYFNRQAKLKQDMETLLKKLQ